MSETVHTAGHEGDNHPGPMTYAGIATILSAITLVEFGIFYVESITSIKSLFVTLLIVLSGIKFALVAMFYMHLKFDNRIFTRLLVTGMVLGTVIMLLLLGLFFLAHPAGM